MDKKIVSTFMFSEPFEQELLWVKFNVEDSFVNEWVIIQSKYTFQGKRKPLFLEKILSQSRFQKFKDKIHCINLDENFNFQFEPTFLYFLKRKLKRWLNAKCNKNYQFIPYAESASFFSEINQRGACLDYLKSKYSEDDIILICDADEIFDFNGDKMDLFIEAAKKHSTPFYLRREVYMFDFDNYTNRSRYCPVARLRDLTSKYVFQIIKHPLLSNRQTIELDKTLIFEYTYCFSREGIIKKLASFAHVLDTDANAVDFCLNNNISLVNINPDKMDSDYIKNPESFFDKIIISEDVGNAPLFVIENIENLKTGIVNENYLLERKKNRIEYNN